jgi:hypothetical protein
MQEIAQQEMKTAEGFVFTYKREYRIKNKTQVKRRNT